MHLAKLFEIAEEHGFKGQYVSLLLAIAAAVEAQSSGALPVNAAGAIGALCCELDLPPEAPRGIEIMARSIGLVGHLIDESRRPLAREIWERTELEVNSNVFGPDPANHSTTA